MSDEGIRILLLEDDPNDAMEVERQLDRAGIRGRYRVVDTFAAYRQALDEFEPDVVLSDHAAGEDSALKALTTLREQRPTTPLILVTGAISEDAIVQAIKAGADDCVLKDRLSRLAPAIRSALAVRAPLARLTDRQMQVFRLLAAGKTTREAAALLDLSIKTVETHRAAVLHRLGMKDLSALVRYAVRTGLIDPRV